MTGEGPVLSSAAALWQRLAPQRWPLPLEALPTEAALVGGAVRDGLLGCLAETPDLDLVVPRGAIDLAQQLARRLGGSAVVLDEPRDIARLVLQGWTIDLAAQEGPNLETDLRRRDYSINAIALPLAPGAGLLDPTGGLAALQRRELVAVAEANLLDDPLRLLRGLRLAAELSFTLEAQSQAWIERHHRAMASVAGERVLAELEKLAQAPGGAAGLAAVLTANLLEPWRGSAPALMPQLQRLTPTWALACGLQDPEWAWALPLARLSCVVDGAGLGRLRSSRLLQKRCQLLRDGFNSLAGRPLVTLPDDERFALHNKLEADLPALLLLAGPGAAEPELLGRWRDPGDPLCHPKPPLDGHQLQTMLTIPPGRELGALLTHLSQERAFGRLARDAEAAVIVPIARAWLARRRD